MKIYEYIAEATDFKIHDFLVASNKRQATQKVRLTIAKMGYQKPKVLNLYPI